MSTSYEPTRAKRKRLLKTFGTCPAGYTTKELEQLFDLLYGIVQSCLYTPRNSPDHN